MAYRRSGQLSRNGIASLTPSDDTAVICISDPHNPIKLQPGWGDRLHLHFHDVCHVVGSNPIVVPCRYHAVKIRLFLDRCEDSTNNNGTPIIRNILAVSEAGRSRAAAVALALDSLGWELARPDLAIHANPRLIWLLSAELRTVIDVPVGGQMIADPPTPAIAVVT